MAVIQDERFGPGIHGGPGPGRPITGDPDRMILGQHQWFVADVGRGVRVGVHRDRSL